MLHVNYKQFGWEQSFRILENLKILSQFSVILLSTLLAILLALKLGYKFPATLLSKLLGISPSSKLGYKYPTIFPRVTVRPTCSNKF
jgi:hypothetical protein